MSKRKVAVFIGRFQPLHAGHVHIMSEALYQCDELLVLVGSANSPSTFKNPFHFEEIRDMIKDVVSRDIYVDYLFDYPYQDDRWMAGVQESVNDYFDPDFDDIYLIGHSKDETSYYINKFPQWKSIAVDNFEGLSATDLREAYYEDRWGSNVDKYFINDEHRDHVEELFSKLDENVVKEYRYCRDYENEWGTGPHLTADALVVRSSHILLIERKNIPGKGLWALPGGFMNKGETFQQSLVRELREETGLKVPTEVILGSIKKSKIYDDPNRDPRSRVITNCFYVHLGEGRLPKVKGADDAKQARWVPLSSVYGDDMYADHFGIISDLVGL